MTLGEIMSVFGLCTMLSEGLLVRISVPYFGEKASMQIGTLQHLPTGSPSDHQTC